MGTKAKKAVERYVIVGTNEGGLFCGYTTQTDVEILESRIATLRAGRHIRHWHGKTGGITSLAAFGPCGPQAGESRIGAPCAMSKANVVAIYSCPPEAIAAFDEQQAR